MFIFLLQCLRPSGRTHQMVITWWRKAVKWNWNVWLRAIQIPLSFGPDRYMGKPIIRAYKWFVKLSQIVKMGFRPLGFGWITIRKPQETRGWNYPARGLNLIGRKIFWCSFCSRSFSRFSRRNYRSSSFLRDRRSSALIQPHCSPNSDEFQEFT